MRVNIYNELFTDTITYNIHRDKPIVFSQKHLHVFVKVCQLNLILNEFL